MTSISLWKVFIDDKGLQPEQIALHDSIKSLDKISALLPGGVYTTFRTYHHDQVLSLHKHFTRLEESSRLAGHPVKINHHELQSSLRSVIDHIPGGDLRFRITVDLEKTPGSIYISSEALEAPPIKNYEQGVAALTYKLERHNPQAKVTGQLEVAEKIRSLFTDEMVNEIITLSESGVVLEGLSSNFFAVKQNTIWTAEKQVLFGTIRSIVLELAQDTGYKIIHQGISVSELQEIDECFITSTSRSILPIVVIDHHPVGSGSPGPVTRKLMIRFNQLLERDLEII